VNLEIRAGRERELAPRKVIAAKECDRSHAILEPEEELERNPGQRNSQPKRGTDWLD